MEKQKTRKRIITLLATMITILLTVQFTAIAASPQGGFSPADMQNPVNASDIHAPVWERFNYSYHFTSGMNYRYDLGRPTTFDGFVPQNVYTANIRRDAMVSLRPPAYGVFSGFIPTEPVSHFFPQPVNPNHWRPTVSSELENPNVIPRYDTLRLGVNAPSNSNPINNVGGTVSQNTSIGIDGGMSRSFHITENGVPSGNSSSMTTLGASGFLPPTSIGTD